MDSVNIWSFALMIPFIPVSNLLILFISRIIKLPNNNSWTTWILSSNSISTKIPLILPFYPHKPYHKLPSQTLLLLVYTNNNAPAADHLVADALALLFKHKNHISSDSKATGFVMAFYKNLLVYHSATMEETTPRTITLTQHDAREVVCELYDTPYNIITNL